MPPCLRGGGWEGGAGGHCHSDAKSIAQDDGDHADEESHDDEDDDKDDDDDDNEDGNHGGLFFFNHEKD